jgi:hypothetical protein
METKAFSSLAELSDDQRRVVESLMGHPLESDDMVLLVVGQPSRDPTSDEKAEARAGLQRIFERIDRYGRDHNISPDEADAAIDAAVREIRSRAP